MAGNDLDLLGDSAMPASGGRHRSKHRRPPTRRRGRSLLPLLIVLIMLGGMVGGVWYGGSRVMAALTGTPDYAGNGSGTVAVEINSGDSATAIAGTLLNKGVVKSIKAFVAAARADPRSLTLQPGAYKLHKQMKASLALALLLDPASRLQAVVTIPEGFSVVQTVARIAARTGLPLAQVQAAARDTARLGLPAYAKGGLEGFLYPATYDIEPGTSARAVLQMMVAKFNAVAASSKLEQRAAAVGLSPYEVLVVASLVQEEGLVVTDMPMIARVIHNRIVAGTPLGIDAAIFYGLGRTGGQLSAADLNKDTPYNTRKVKGLPPTPIDSPGADAVSAALAPTPGDWLYYVLKDKQGHQFFTDSYQAFVDQKAKSIKEGVFK
ncbi:MAG: endolytic transglycosylase MltG [Pseudonocardiales bacterium]|nr:MAG: endolytic transglycosylase MltG [Pseudonocardiales bacterium]